jgi:hypothetical protein
MKLTKETKIRLTHALTSEKAAEEVEQALNQDIASEVQDYLSNNPQIIDDAVAESIANDPSIGSKLTKGSKLIFCIDNGDYTTLQQAIDTAVSGDVILVGPKSGSWGDIELKAGVSIHGLQPVRGRDVVVGQISFNSVSGSASSNTISVSNLRTQQLSGKNSIVITGNIAYRLRFNGMWLLKDQSVQEDVVLIQNNASGSSCYIEHSIIQVNASNADFGSLIKSNCPYLKMMYCDFSGGNLPIYIQGGLLEAVRCKIESNTTNNLMQADSGATIVFGSGLLRNLSADANGVQLNSGSILSIGGSTVFDISEGAGYCVKGDGTYLYDNVVTFADIPILNPRNKKIQNTLSIAQYSNTPNIVA